MKKRPLNQVWALDIRKLTLLERVWVGFILWDLGIQPYPTPAPQTNPK